MSQTLGARLLRHAQRVPQRVALHAADASGRLRAWTWRGWWEEAGRLAAGLLVEGVRAGDRVVVLDVPPSRLVVWDVALMWCGAVAILPWPGRQPEARRAWLSQLEWAWEVAPQATLAARGAACSPDDTIALWRPRAEAPITEAALLGAGGSPPAWPEDPETPTTILSTSSAHGTPRAVLWTHASLGAHLDAFARQALWTARDVIRSRIPATTAIGRLAMWSSVEVGAQLVLERPLPWEASDRASTEAHPSTILVASPGDLARLHQHLLLLEAEARTPTTPRERLGLWRDQLTRRLRRAPTLDPLRAHVSPQLRLIFTGGAPLVHPARRAFSAWGVPALEGYGLTETSGLLTLSHPEVDAPGSVGRALGSMDVTRAPDGELLARGPALAAGYVEGDRLIPLSDADGWFHTGDMGSFDARGCLSVSGRVRDRITLTSGQHIAPRAVERRLCASPWIAHALVVGSGRPYLIALLVLSPHALQRFAQEHGLAGLPPDALPGHPLVHAHLAEQLATANADAPTHEAIRKFTIIDLPTHAGSPWLTPAGALQRAAVATRYAEAIERMFS